MATRFGVSELIIGLTIVVAGTWLSEVVTSTKQMAGYDFESLVYGRVFTGAFVGDDQRSLESLRWPSPGVNVNWETDAKYIKQSVCHRIWRLFDVAARALQFHCGARTGGSPVTLHPRLKTRVLLCKNSVAVSCAKSHELHTLDHR